MSASVLVSLMVVIIAFVLFFFLSFRGVNLFLTVFACTVLVCLCTPDGLTSIFTTFLPSMGNMFQQFFLHHRRRVRLLSDGEWPGRCHGHPHDQNLR